MNCLLSWKSRPAGTFWADKVMFCQKVVPQGPFGQTKLSPKAAYWYYWGRGGGQDHLNPELGGQRGAGGTLTAC